MTERFYPGPLTFEGAVYTREVVAGQAVWRSESGAVVTALKERVGRGWRYLRPTPEPEGVLPDLPGREEVLSILEDALDPLDVPVFDVDEDPERFKDDSGRPNHGKVADFLSDLYPFATYSDTREVLVYDPRTGTYRPAKAVVGGTVERFVREKATARFVAEVLGHLERRSYRSRTEFDAQPGFVVANGVLDPETGEVGDWDSARLDTVRLPVTFDPEATCPRFTRFLRQVVSQEDALVLQEGVGYCLLKGMPFHVAFLLVGDGANGKSTFHGVVKALLGQENVSSETLQSLGHRFATSSLVGKLANIAADLPTWPVRDAGVFKGLTGNDIIRAEKKHRDAFTFTNHAKLWFSANRVPRTEDESHAYFRRWRIVPFPDTFGLDEADPHLLAKLTSPEELSGVLNWAVEGLRRLLDQGGFSDTPRVEEIRDAYVRLSDPVAAFVEDRVLVDPEAEETKDDLYEAYVNHVRGRGLLAVLNSVFAKDLKRVVPSVREGRPTRGGLRVQMWHGVRLLPEEEEGGQGSAGRPRHGGQGYQGYFPSKGESEDE